WAPDGTNARIEPLERELRLEDREEAQRLFGPYDANLKTIRQKTGAKIVVRNGAIKIAGTRVQVENAYRAFAEVREVLDARGKLEEGDLDKILDAQGG